MRYYGYRIVSMYKCELTLYTQWADKRPHNEDYDGMYHVIEKRWYVNKDTMINRLLEQGFSEEELNKAIAYLDAEPTLNRSYRV